MRQLEAMLLNQRYMHQAQKVMAWVGHSPRRFDALVQLVAGEDRKLAQKAAWPMSYVAAAHPDWALKHLPALLATIKKPDVHNGVVRSVVRLLQFVDIPEELNGEVMDSCFRYIEDIREKPAVKAFALTVLHQLSQTYPDILPEIRTLVASRIEHETPAFKARARVFLR